jgi:hypothetical protein
MLQVAALAALFVEGIAGNSPVPTAFLNSLSDAIEVGIISGVALVGCSLPELAVTPRSSSSAVGPSLRALWQTRSDESSWCLFFALSAGGIGTNIRWRDVLADAFVSDSEATTMAPVCFRGVPGVLGDLGGLLNSLSASLPSMQKKLAVPRVR